MQTPYPDDPLDASTTSLAQAAFSMLEDYQSLPTGGHLPGPVRFDELDATEAERALLNDPDVGRLWGWGSGTQQNVFTTSGGRNPVQPESLLLALIRGAYDDLWRKGAVDMEQYLDAVVANINRVRALMQGETLATTAITGVSLLMPPGSELNTPWGTVRPLTERD